MSRTSPSSTTRPAYITTTRSAISATTPRSCVMNRIDHAQLSLELAHQVEDLRLDGHVQRGRRLVGDQQFGMAGRGPSRSSRAAACRRTSGAGSSMRAARDRECRPGPASRSRASTRVPRVLMRWCSATASAIWSPIVVNGIEARHRLLEDHGDFVAAHRADLGVRECQQVSALEFNFSAHDSTRRRDEAHDRKAGDRLAGSGLPDNCYRFAAPNVEGDAIDGPDNAVFGMEVRLQVANGQKRPARRGFRLRPVFRRNHRHGAMILRSQGLFARKRLGTSTPAASTIMLLIVR